ncbi:MAG: patatin-like phospholipase family protein, partial [Bacteroidia bacterium]
MPLVKKYLALMTFMALIPVYYGQKVGVVMSGGGASGLSHIGVLKALEENHIPIDYIAGTSIGSLIGAYYASGYSPKEIEDLVKTSFFQKVTKGDMPARYAYLLKKRDDYASWHSFRLSLDRKILDNLPTNVINSVPIDYYLMETFCGVNAKSKSNFDSLLVPFRCVASDVVNNKEVIFRTGDLSSSIRASMSYPFYLRPISIDNKLLFDGGLYNNFPTDVMQDEFHPDFIIGSTVAEKSISPEDDNLYLQLRHLMISQSNSELIKNGVVIEPWSDVNIFNFEDAIRLIDSGYAAAMRQMPEIKKQVQRMADAEALNVKRAEFKRAANQDSILFNQVNISGVNKSVERFIKKSIFYKNKPFTLSALKKRYFRLTTDDKIRSVYPVVEKDSASSFYRLNLMAKRQKSFYFDVGGDVSNRPISEIFVALQYNYLGKIGFTAYANGYFGKLNTSSLTKLRFDFPARVPFYIEPCFTYSRWDYFKSSPLFYSFEK